MAPRSNPNSKPGSLRRFLQTRLREIDEKRNEPESLAAAAGYQAFLAKHHWTATELIDDLDATYVHMELRHRDDKMRALLSSEHLARCIEGLIAEVGPVGIALIERRDHFVHTFQYFAFLLSESRATPPQELLDERMKVRQAANENIDDLARVMRRNPALVAQLQPIVNDIRDGMLFLQSISAPHEPLLELRGKRGTVNQAAGAWRGLLVRAFDTVVPAKTPKRAVTIAGILRLLDVEVSANQVGAELRRRPRKQERDILSLMKAAK